MANEIGKKAQQAQDRRAAIRAERLAAALRENLRRRKAQLRDRRRATDGDEPPQE